MDNSGFTMIELVVVLAIIAVLAGVLTPMVINYVAEARVTAAKNDADGIANAISRFEKDVGRYPMFTVGTTALKDSDANCNRLDGPGNTPSAAPAQWTSGVAANCTLLAQLATNAPAYTVPTNQAQPNRWKGPYINSAADPWGNRYSVNIINGKTSSANACFVLSAGPDGTIDTAFDISKNSQIVPAGDDILSRIR